MRHWFTAVRITGIAGLMLGAASGLLHWSGFWPGLSELALGRACALGWLGGILLAFPLAWWLSRRPAPARVPPPLLKKVSGTTLTLVALAPVGLWVTALLPGGLLRGDLGGPGKITRPNLILISIDALRADYLDIYGTPAGRTPAIDAFAKEATQYDSAYNSSPWTLTSLGCLFTTSRAPSQCGLKIPFQENQGWYGEYAALPKNMPLVPERLRRAGYETAAELTNLMLLPERGWARGYDWYRNETRTSDPRHTLDCAERVTQSAAAWLRLNRRRPFFLWVHYFDPHGPYDAPTTPESVRKKFKHWWMAGNRQYWDARVEHGSAATKAEWAAMCRAMYGEEVKYVDRYVGVLLRTIKADGLWDHSLIILTSDHGEELLDHGGWEHGHTMHREVTWVPLLVKWPRGVQADPRVTQTVESADVGATLLSFAGLSVGKDSAPALPRKNGLPGQEVYAEGLLYGPEQTALTTDDWRIFYHPYQILPTGGHFEVFNRHTDPWEHTNLAPTGAAAALEARLERLSAAAEVRAKRNWRRISTTEQSVVPGPAEQQELRSLGYLR